MNIGRLKEKSYHGTKDFPIALYHSPGLIAPYHWHDECEFIYMNSGSARCRIGVDNFELKKGECVFVKAGALHSLSEELGVNFDFHAIVFHPTLLYNDIDRCNKYLSTQYNINNRFSPNNRVEQKIIETVKLLRDTYESKSFAYELKVKFYLFDIFSYIFECGLFQEASHNENNNITERLEKVIKYIHTNSKSQISVYDLAKEAGYSTSHFTHFFKEITGKTPIEYVNRQRIYYACDMLKHTELSVLNVSLECGFENVGYFIKTFKKYTNNTPYQYKKKEALPFFENTFSSNQNNKFTDRSSNPHPHLPELLLQDT